VRAGNVAAGAPAAASIRGQLSFHSGCLTPLVDLRRHKLVTRFPQTKAKHDREVSSALLDLAAQCRFAQTSQTSLLANARLRTPGGVFPSEKAEN